MNNKALYDELTQKYYEYFTNDPRLPDLFEMIWDLDPNTLIKYIEHEFKEEGINNLQGRSA